MFKNITYGIGYIDSLPYPIVWVTTYRKPIFILETLNPLDRIPIAMEILPDQIHLLVDCKPQPRLSDTRKILKGSTARWLFLKHSEMKKQLWGGH